MAGAELRAGKVCKLLLDRPKPFGFIAPAEGGPNLYFNEAQLGHQRTWAEFCGIVTKYDDCEAPVSFRIETGRGGKLQAAGVVVHDAEELAGMDADSDGTITDAELQAYLAEHPELAEASLTKWEMRKRQIEYVQHSMLLAGASPASALSVSGLHPACAPLRVR